MNMKWTYIIILEIQGDPFSEPIYLEGNIRKWNGGFGDIVKSSSLKLTLNVWAKERKFMTNIHFL